MGKIQVLLLHLVFEKVDKTEESNNVCNFLTWLTVCYEGCERG